MLAFALDPFDPRGWAPGPAPDDVAYLSLSSRIDCTAILDHQDYLWARQFLWCHSYGSGAIDPETMAIDRQDGIYARRSVPIPGRKTPSGRQAYGNLWLHKASLHRAVGAPPPLHLIGDHLNGNTLDNRRCNLRWATASMNARNTHGKAWDEVYGCN